MWGMLPFSLKKVTHMPKLTEMQIKSAKPAETGYRMTDERGLFLYITPTGNKIWRVRLRKDGKDTAITLGKYPALRLSDARTRRDELLRDIAQGNDPRKKEPEMPTFRAVAEEWIRANSGVWRLTNKATVEQRLTSNVYDPLGDTPINKITARDVLDAMRVIEARGALEVAKKTLAIVGQIMRYAVSAQYIQADPTRDLRGALQKRVVGHFAAATTERDAAVIVRAVRNYQGAMVVRLAMEFLMLTFVRPGNVRYARWQDIDLKKKVWSIPAEQMKMAKPHDVPLSRQALRVLEEVKAYSEGYDLVFPALRNRRKPLSEPVFTTALRCAGIPKELMSAHGFRSMASSLLNEAGEHPDLIEKQLAHVSGDKIRAAYNRAEYWKKRVDLMQTWADMVDRLERD